MKRRDIVEEKVLFEGTPEEVQQQMRKYSRRSFVWVAVSLFGGWFGLRKIGSLPDADGVKSLFRWGLGKDESVFSTLFSSNSRTDEHPLNAKVEDRVNGDVGLGEDFDPETWTLTLLTSDGKSQEFNLDDIKKLPRHEMVTELRCIEGWSVLVHWSGVRFKDFVDQHAPQDRAVRYVSMRTPDEEYYVGLDMLSALHPQTLLAFGMNGEPLTLEHGAPLRLVIPVKYGVKNLKRIGTIELTNTRPPDYWADEGYDWYCGL